MISQLSYIMTLANSIIGVSVLAMPFCFKQCGIILAVIVLLLSSVLSRLACHFLVKSAVMSRRRNFELLAFHAFGHMGKFLVELFIIGFLVGTCIAFFVVMGDLGPQIVGNVIDKKPEDIRTSLLITTSVFIVLPLGLLRNIDSLSSISTATIVFYLCLVLKVMTESMQHIFTGDWHEHVYYWRPSGILQCIPIFSMALFCQTQLFEIYETIPNVSLEKMNEVVRGALNICTIVYLCVGFFGYVAFCTQPFSGNILMSFEPSMSSEMIKLGFVFSIAFSFPLVIFPCRASLNSLLFRRVYTHEPSINYMPEARFRCLTTAIVSISLIAGILIPNIEFVLGLVGSTIGVMICLIFPAVFFISISSKNTNERLIAQAILFIGICIMILSTYANLYAMEESTNTKSLATTTKPLSQINSLPLNVNKDDGHIMANVPKNAEILPDIKEKLDQVPGINVDNSINVKVKDVRQEPPIPVERILVTEKSVIGTQKSVENIVATFGPEIKKIVEQIKTLGEDVNKVSDTIGKDSVIKAVESIVSKTEEKINIEEQKERSMDIQKNDNLINSDAIKKEESELAADAEAANMVAAERHENLRKTLEKHKLEQLQMMQEQKEILKDIKEQKQKMERERVRIAKDMEVNKENEKKSRILEQGAMPSKGEKNLINFDTNSDKQHLNEINENGENKVYDAELNQVNQQLEKSDYKKDAETEIYAKRISEHESVHNVNGNKEGVRSNSFPINEAGNIETINNINTKDQELSLRVQDTNELPKGPILNALTKRALQKPISIDKLNHDENNLENSHQHSDLLNNVIPNVQENQNLKTEDQKVEDRYSLPIALKIRNQTKIYNASMQVVDKSGENIQLIRRDILQNHEREKREANPEMEGSHTKVRIAATEKRLQTVVKESAINDGREECHRAHDVEENLIKSKKESDRNLLKIGSTEISLIKTNVYLSEQELINTMSVDSKISARSEYIKVKQRDLKAVDSE